MESHFLEHTKPYCVLNVLDNDKGHEICSYMLSWLIPKYDVITILHDGGGYEYHGLKYMRELSITTDEPVLYLHTKGAYNVSSFQEKVIDMWRNEFITHIDEYLDTINTNVPICMCPFTGAMRVTWYNGFIINSSAARILPEIKEEANRYAYEVLFQKVKNISVIGRIYSDVDNTSTDSNTESKLRMRDYISNERYMNNYYNADKIIRKDSDKIYVSFTTWKARVKNIRPVLDSIKEQTIKPDKCILWLYKYEITEEDIQDIINDEFIEIRWVDKNLKSFKKFLTIEQCPDVYNIVLDDDRKYDKNTIETLLKYSNDNNDKCVISYYADICNIYGEPWGTNPGNISTNIKWVNDSCVLYPPNIFPMECFDYFYKIMYGRELISDECFLMPFLIYNNIKIVNITTFSEYNKISPIINDMQISALHKKFFYNNDGSDTKHNKKNLLLNNICELLPEKYRLSYIEKFPDFGKDVVFNKKVILSMTTWKKRIHQIPVVIDSILKNTKVPDKIVINLALEEFPNKMDDFSEDIKKYINSKSEIIELYWLCKDTKVWKKLIPTLIRYKNDIIISIDDDFIYPNDFIETMYNDFVSNKEKYPISGNRVCINGIKYHCGCSSLVMYKFFMNELGMLTDDIYNAGADDVYYTHVVVNGGSHYITCSKMFFHNMESLHDSDDKGYSVNSHININNAVSLCSDKGIKSTYKNINFICETDNIKTDICPNINNNIDVIKKSNSRNNTKFPQILVLIEKSQFNPILTPISNEFSKHFDTQIIDCQNRNYVSCYNKLSDYAKLYDWVLLIKSNVSFEWASAKYFSTIISKIKEISKRTDVGIYSINNANRVSNIITSSYVKTNITQDQFLFINTQLLDKCSNLIFEDSMGFGFIDYLCKLSNKLNLSTLVSIDIPLKTYTNVENYDNPTIYKLRKNFLERNPL